MTHIRTLIVDDEAPARRWLRSLCAKHADLAIIAECATAAQATHKLRAGGVDLLLLDVRLGPYTGFDILDDVPEARVPIVVFVTAYDQHAIRAFETNAIDYLLKPVSEERFRKTVERVREQMASGLVSHVRTELRATLASLEKSLYGPRDLSRLPRIVGERDNAFHPLAVDEIEFIDVFGNDVMIHTVGDPRPYSRRSTLQDIGSQLGSRDFLRISRACVVNLGCVTRIERDAHSAFWFVLKSGRQLPVGRTYRHKIAEFVRARTREGAPPAARPENQ